MTKTEIKQEIERLKKLRDSAKNQDDKDFYNSLIEQKIEQLREIEEKEKSAGQKIGSTIGRIGGAVVGTVMGVVDDCLVGNTDKKATQRTRGKYADGGEAIGSAIGGAIEKLSGVVKNRRK